MKDTAELNHARLFLHECTLILDCKSMYSSLLDSIFDEYTYFLNDNFSSIIFSEGTIKLYRLFFNKLKEYVNSRPFGQIQAFVYLDIDWYNLRTQYLIPFIKSGINDFRTKKLHYDSVLEQMDLNNKPSNKEILRQVNFLYRDIEKLKKT